MAPRLGRIAIVPLHVLGRRFVQGEIETTHQVRQCQVELGVREAGQLERLGSLARLIS